MWVKFWKNGLSCSVADLSKFGSRCRWLPRFYIFQFSLSRDTSLVKFSHDLQLLCEVVTVKKSETCWIKHNFRGRGDKQILFHSTYSTYVLIRIPHMSNVHRRHHSTELTSIANNSFIVYSVTEYLRSSMLYNFGRFCRSVCMYVCLSKALT